MAVSYAVRDLLGRQIAARSNEIPAFTLLLSSLYRPLALY